ncbi:MAG: peptidoglycan DD-metalloendopeptidase family protein [Bacteroidota bacterium]
MKYLLLFCLVTGFSCLTMAQSQSDYQNTADKFEKFYNAGKYNEVFEMFSADMKSALPVQKTIDFLTGLGTQAGKITERTFVGFENGSYASYKTVFENATFLLNISLDQKKEINGLLVKPYVESSSEVLERNVTKMILPFKGVWTVGWGGDTKEQNYHVEYPSQKGAFDLIVTDENGKSHKGNGAKNEDYFAFGQELIAPCDGTIEIVVDGIPDNKPGQSNPLYVPGNTVVIKTTNDEYLLFAHFKQNSITVQEGQSVKQGDLLGLCGNSGNSSEPHLHFHIQNVALMQFAIGAKCFFSDILVNGTLQSEVSPVKGDKVANP